MNIKFFTVTLLALAVAGSAVLTGCNREEESSYTTTPPATMEEPAATDTGMDAEPGTTEMETEVEEEPEAGAMNTEPTGDVATEIDQAAQHTKDAAKAAGEQGKEAVQSGLQKAGDAMHKAADNMEHHQ